jgi:hypothetical protein
MYAMPNRRATASIAAAELSGDGSLSGLPTSRWDPPGLLEGDRARPFALWMT